MATKKGTEASETEKALKKQVTAEKKKAREAEAYSVKGCTAWCFNDSPCGRRHTNHQTPSHFRNQEVRLSPRPKKYCPR